MSFSQKEIDMLSMFVDSDLLTQLCDDPISLYRIAMERAFTDGMEGPYVDSLRRCIRALRSCSVYRGTEAWDTLIQLP